MIDNHKQVANSIFLGRQDKDLRAMVEVESSINAECNFSMYDENGSTFMSSECVQMEKQIRVDPSSLRESSSVRRTSFAELLLQTTADAEIKSLHLPELKPPKLKFLSNSLPNSTTSSPRFRSLPSKGNMKNGDQLMFSPEMLQLTRSKSCGQGKACTPSDDYDFWLIKTNAVECKNTRESRMTQLESTKDSPRNGIRLDSIDSSYEKFKCSALCLFLPGFGKAKPIRSKREEKEAEDVLSRAVSLEKFECGSWASAAIVPDNVRSDSSHLFFDLPHEMICSGGSNDVYSPVSAAFWFDKTHKGILKNGSCRKSDASSRHVRFSTSAPTPSHPASPASCISPRLRKAREDFNAFLEAQST